MRRLLVVLALMLAGSAAITVAGEGLLAPPDDTPPAADAVLDAVRSVLSPVAPVDPGAALAPVVPTPAGDTVADVVAVPAASPARVPEPSPAPQKERAAADDARCEPLTVTLSAGPRAVAPGEQSTLLVAIGHSGNRPLSRVSLTHQLTGSDGVRFIIASTNPPADSVSAGKVVFDNLGRLGVGATRQVQVVLAVHRAAKAGQITSDARATGDCEAGSAGNVAVSGRGSLQEPTITGPAAGVAGAPAPSASKAAAAPAPAASRAAAAATPAPAGTGLLTRTGGLVGLAVACWLTAAGVGLQIVAGRRRPRRRRPANRPVRWMCEERV